MILQKTALLDTMKHCLPGVEKSNSLIEGADTFVFGHGAIHSYNDGISVSASFDSGDLTGAVKSMDFYKLISKVPAEQIEITPADGEWLLKTDSMEAHIKLVQSKISEYISELQINDLEWSTLPEDFFEGVRLCKIGCNHSIQRGIYANGTDLISTDTIRINHFKMSAEMPVFWLDDPAVTELMKLTDIKEYSIQPSWVHFKNESGVIFSCKRKADSQYPFQQLMSHVTNHGKQESDPVYKFPPNINEVIDRVSVLAGTIRDALAVQMRISKEAITIESSKDSGSIKEIVPFSEPIEQLEAGQVINMWVEPSFLMEASKKVVGFFVKEHSQGERVQKNIVFFNDRYTQIVATYIDG
jgi:hypothetical protein